MLQKFNDTFPLGQNSLSSVPPAWQKNNTSFSIMHVESCTIHGLHGKHNICNAEQLVITTTAELGSFTNSVQWMLYQDCDDLTVLGINLSKNRRHWYKIEVPQKRPDVQLLGLYRACKFFLMTECAYYPLMWSLMHPAHHLNRQISYLLQQPYSGFNAKFILFENQSPRTQW